MGLLISAKQNFPEKPALSSRFRFALALALFLGVFFLDRGGVLFFHRFFALLRLLGEQVEVRVVFAVLVEGRVVIIVPVHVHRVIVAAERVIVVIVPVVIIVVISEVSGTAGQLQLEVLRMCVLKNSVSLILRFFDWAVSVTRL